MNSTLGWWPWAVGGVVVIAGGVIFYQWRSLTIVQSDLASTTIALIAAREETEKLSGRLATTTEQLDEAIERNDDFERQIRKISGTVGTLEKLSQTDKELLEKYSKVYFLNEHYVPKKLSLIDKSYWYDEKKPQEFHGEAIDFLENLLEAAADNGIDLRVASAYRSFGTQAALKTAYRVTYGAGTANQFSADQGYSEHQLATAVDFATPDSATTLVVSFESTPAFAWLKENAARYGFTLSYPKGNAYYQYEPWHWRFVGRDLARDLVREGKHFYDLDQREINEYLVELFD